MKRKHILILVPILILVLLSTLCITKINKSLTPSEKEIISDYIYYFIHKKSIDQKVQQVFCEELEKGMDMEKVKSIISENYDVEYSIDVWQETTLWLNESDLKKNIRLFGKNLRLAFTGGKYLYTYYYYGLDNIQDVCLPLGETGYKYTLKRAPK